MQANVDGTNIKSFFEKNLHSFKRMTNQEYLPCNCPSYEHIEKVFTIDHSKINKPKIIFIDSNSHEVISADKHGCYCDVILERHILNDSISIINLATDVNKIYWKNNVNNTIFYIDKYFKFVLMEKTEVNNFLLYGKHIQPYPIPKCLIPNLERRTVALHSKTSDSITLVLPKLKPEDDCDNISVASVKFTVYYKKYSEEENLKCDGNCNQEVSFGRNVLINGMKPFTKYVFSVGIRNYFTDLKGIPENIGPAIILQTAAGGMY